MSPLVKFLVFLQLLLLSLSALAQSYQFKIEGSYMAERDTDTPVTVNYSIDWNETSSAIQGIYKDNFFAQTGPQVVSGTVTPTGRSFNVILPEESEGVKSIAVTVQSSGIVSGTVSTTVRALDNLGTLVETSNNPTIMSAQSTNFAQTGNCVIGFGALTGYCGLFAGNFNEISDNANRCDISSSGQARIELATNTEFHLYSNYISAINNEFTTIGSFLPSPQSNNVSITGRECGSIQGTSFITGNCKTLNLSGVFYDQATNITFTGTLSINDEVTGETCSYGLSLTREVIY